jgi:hypothetical protein
VSIARGIMGWSSVIILEEMFALLCWKHPGVIVSCGFSNRATTHVDRLYKVLVCESISEPGLISSLLHL